MTQHATYNEVELKSIKHFGPQSHETHCYEANLYINGRKLAIVGNDGHGGCDQFEPISKVTEMLVDNMFTLQELEVVCCEIINRHLVEKELKKVLKKISYLDNGGLYQMPAKLKPTAENVGIIKKAPWYKPSFIMLNELSFEDAYQAFHKAG